MPERAETSLASSLRLTRFALDRISRAEPILNSPVPRCLEPSHCDGTGEVQAADIFRGWNTEKLLGMGCRDPLRQTARFAAEDQRIARLVADFTKRASRFFAEVPPLTGRERLLQVFPVINRLPMEMLPVIEPGPAKPFLVNPEPQRTNQPKLRSQCDAGPANRAGVWGNFRLIENDM